MQKKEEEHQAEVTRLKEDIARAARLNKLQKHDLELVLRDKAIVEKEHETLQIAMSKRATDDQKIKKLCVEMENEAKAAKPNWLLVKRRAPSGYPN